MFFTCSDGKIFLLTPLAPFGGHPVAFIRFVILHVQSTSTATVKKRS